jgi:2-C-methyl-D-erythritol 2,4-cyclodiphosphate synthase
MHRIGMGYDVHQLAEGYELWIGGVKVPHEKGSVGHSDGDVLIHAICDALLGAACLGDIGFHFPDTDPNLKGIDSKLLLKQVSFMVQSEGGFKIENIDSTVCLQTPKITTYVRDMREKLAEILGIKSMDISIKATTTEKMGFVGSGEGISAYAVVLLTKKKKKI